MVCFSNSKHSANIFFFCLIHTQVLTFVLIFFVPFHTYGSCSYEEFKFFVFNILEDCVLLRFFLLLLI